MEFRMNVRSVTESKASVDPSQFKLSMRATVASVNIITCEHDGAHYGLTATAFSSVSSDPPTILICVNGNASACQHILAAGHFCVNVLTRGMEKLADAFSGAVPPEKRFITGNWRQLDSGNLAVEGCAAAFDCEVSTALQEGTHWIVSGKVTQCERYDTSPLVYANGTYGAFAPALSAS
jgi:flavin reductase